jgi:hypothetical protein
LLLYVLMKKSDTFIWTSQADAPFKELKKMLATAPVLASPLPKEPMLLYGEAVRAGGFICWHILDRLFDLELREQ